MPTFPPPAAADPPSEGAVVPDDPDDPHAVRVRQAVNRATQAVAVDPLLTIVPRFELCFRGVRGLVLRKV
ncbi:hypothetical protein Sme01_26380 [Sphaerisporangium melleum]|nr:hypothetical protein Sme01_26380 [Sphaerisporangium melleum]